MLAVELFTLICSDWNCSLLIIILDVNVKKVLPSNNSWNFVLFWHNHINAINIHLCKGENIFLYLLITPNCLYKAKTSNQYYTCCPKRDMTKVWLIIGFPLQFYGTTHNLIAQSLIWMPKTMILICFGYNIVLFDDIWILQILRFVNTIHLNYTRFDD